MKKCVFFVAVFLSSMWMACSKSNNADSLLSTQTAKVVYVNCSCGANMNLTDGESAFSPIENRSDSRFAALNLSSFVQSNELNFGDTLEIEYVFTETLFDETQCEVVCDLVGGLNIELNKVVKE